MSAALPLFYTHLLCAQHGEGITTPPPPLLLPFLSFLVLPFLFKMNFRFHLSISLKIYVELLIVVSLNV